MNDVKKTTDERGEVYGDFGQGCDNIGHIMSALQRAHMLSHSTMLDATAYARFFPIAQKLVRLATSLDHEDSWHDIAGYATLNEALAKENNRA